MTNEEMNTLIIGDTEYEIVDEAGRNSIGTLSALNTDSKTNLVTAINEHEAQINEHESQINGIPTKTSDLQNDSGYWTDTSLYIERGEVLLTPSAADTLTTGNITFANAFAEPPTVQVTCRSSVNNTVYSVDNITTTGFSIAFTRETTTNTYFQWLAIGTKATN